MGKLALAHPTILLTNQAIELVNRLPKNEVSSMDYYAIAGALSAASELAPAKEYAQLAIDTAKSIPQRLIALRSKAGLSFQISEPDIGRDEYKKSLEILNYSNTGSSVMYNDWAKKTANITTEVLWGYSEGNIGNLTGALSHVNNAKTILLTLPVGPGLTPYIKNISEAEAVITAAIKVNESNNGPPSSVTKHEKDRRYD